MIGRKKAPYVNFIRGLPYVCKPTDIRPPRLWWEIRPKTLVNNFHQLSAYYRQTPLTIRWWQSQYEQAFRYAFNSTNLCASYHYQLQYNKTKKINTNLLLLSDSSSRLLVIVDNSTGCISKREMISMAIYGISLLPTHTKFIGWMVGREEKR